MAVDTAQSYRQSPRPAAPQVSFTLEGDRLIVDAGRRSGVIALAEVAELRLAYEPRTIAQRLYRTRVTLADGRRFAFTSVTWKSMVQAQSQDRDYSAFVRALIAAAANANPMCRLIAGRPWPIWVLVTIVAGLILVALAFFVWRAFAADAAAAGWLGLAIGAVSVWQVVPMVRLNRPRTFTPDDLPRDLLP